MSQASIQTAIYRGMAIAGQKLGTPFAVYRSAGTNPIQPANLITTLPSVFTSAKTSGFNFTRNTTPDDVTFSVLSDGNQLQVGDYMVGSSTYYIAAMPPMLDIIAVLCLRTASVTRPGDALSTTGGKAPALPSQPSSTGSYWGASRTAAASILAAGELPLFAGIPCAMVGTTGRATGSGELPTDPAGPSRWRIYLPPSAFPRGGIRYGDIIADDEGSRFQVNSAYFSPIGYRVEATHLEA